MMVSIRFQSSRDHLPEHVEGPFEYIQVHHGSMEAGTAAGEVVYDFAAINQDGTYDAGPTSAKHDGYTDFVVYDTKAASASVAETAGRRHTLPPAKFGVAVVDGEDENAAHLFVRVGFVDAAGCVPEAFLTLDVYGLQGALPHDPDVVERKKRQARMIAEALSDYADKHGLGEGAFELGVA